MESGSSVRLAASKLRSEVQCVSKALDLLSCFSLEHPEWGVTEISEYLGLCKSAAHRLLATCAEFKFVERTSSRRYRLGVKILELGNVYRFDQRLLSLAESPLRLLAQETGTVAHLATLDGRETLELLRSSAPRASRFSPHPILRGPVHATALGKILLAHGGEQSFAQYVGKRSVFRRYTPHTLTTPEQLKRNLETIPEQGYAFSDRELKLECRCLAVPVRNSAGDLVSAISISGTVENLNERKLPFLLGRLFHAAESLRRGL